MVVVVEVCGAGKETVSEILKTRHPALHMCRGVCSGGTGLVTFVLL